jgi:uncharacterized protein YrrD
MDCASGSGKQKHNHAGMEALMRVDLGSDVYTSDDKKVGTVDRIVLDGESKAILSLVVKSGMINQHHRIVDVNMVTSQDDDGVHLNLPESEYDQLSDFVEQQYVSVPSEDYDALPFIIPNAGGGGGYLYGAPYIGRGFEGRQDSFFDSAPTRETIVENRSNLEDTDVTISKGTDVVGSNGDKLGSVHEIFYSADGHLDGFVVKTGGLFSHEDIRVPMEWVDEAGGDQIRLNLTAEEAETRSYDVENNTL